MNENYENLDKFFKIDLKIKDLILKTRPNEKTYDTSGAIKYVDNLIKELDTIKDYFFWVIDTYNMSPYLKDVINNSLNEYNEKLLNSNYDYWFIIFIYFSIYNWHRMKYFFIIHYIKMKCMKIIIYCFAFFQKILLLFY